MRLLVALLAALVLAPAAAAAPHVVTNFADVTGPRQAPLPGSLRYILLDKNTKPGDVITFATPSEITVIGPIVVPPRLSGIVIEGAAGTGRAAIRSIAAGRYVDGAIGLSIHANNVVVRNLVFNDAALSLGDGNVGARVFNNLFIGARGAFLTGNSRGAIVQGNVFEGRAPVAMNASLSRGMQILDNKFRGTGGALFAEPTFGVLVQKNEFAVGRTQLELDGGRVLDNDFTGGSLILRTVQNPRRQVRFALNEATGGTFGFIADGRLLVESNTFTGVRRIELLCIPSTTRGPDLRFSNNTVTGGGGMLAGGHCGRPGRIDVISSTFQGALGVGLRAEAGQVYVKSSTFTGNAGGIAVARGARAEVRGGVITGNAGAGILIHRGPRPTIVSRVPMGGNTGPGIDRAPVGVSPRAAPGAPTLVYDEKKVKLRGKACPRCLVEIYESEEGAKLGNPGYGEGIRLLGVVKANGLGRFVFPAGGDFDCPPSGLVTATATHTLKGTSEFSADEPCGCVVSSRFGVDASRVPTTGFGNYGIEVFFEPGTVVKAAELTDTATDLRPPDNALGPSFGWDELRVEPPVPGAPYAFLVNVGYNPGAPAPATWPLQVWRFVVPYEPPPEAKGACRAVLDYVYLPPPPE